MALCDDWAAVTNHLGPETDAAFRRALELCRQLQHTPHLFAVIWGLHEIALYRADYRESLALSQHCLSIAQELQDGTLLLQAHHALWGAYHFSGDHLEALAHVEAGLSLYDCSLHEASSVHFGWHDAGACALEISALSLWNVGLLDQAKRRQQDLIEHTAKLKEPVNRADGYVYTSLFYHLLREPALAQPYAEQALQLTTERHQPGLRISGMAVLGWSIAMQGGAREGIPLIEEGITAADAMGQRHHYSQYNAMLAEAYLVAGRATDAIGVLDQAIAAFQRFRDLVCAPDLWILKGDAMFSLDAPVQTIVECYTHALNLAQELGAKVSEVRAATALARLYQRQGKNADVDQLLAPLTTQFTEGFDTVDLCEARQILDIIRVIQ